MTKFSTYQTINELRDAFGLQKALETDSRQGWRYVERLPLLLRLKLWFVKLIK